MYRVLKYLLFLSSFCLGAQPLFIPNVGQWKESFVAKMDLRFGAYFYEENGYRAIIYNPEETHFLKMGKSLGNKTMNGKLMFIYQALSAFKIWHGIEPDINKDVIKLLD